MKNLNLLEIQVVLAAIGMNVVESHVLYIVFAIYGLINGALLVAAWVVYLRDPKRSEEETND